MPNFQPSSVINFTGSIAGSPASNVASNAFTSFNDTISFRDGVIPNGTLNAFSPNAGTATQDGNVVVNIDYTYTNGARVADYYIIFYKQGGGTVSPSNPCIIVNASSGVASSATINVVPGSPYTFAFSSARVTKDGVKASSPQNQTARTMIAGNYTANIAGISAAAIASAGKVVSATIDKQAINYSVTGAATPTSINITATTQNITTPYYTFYRDIGAGFVEIQARSTDNSLSAYSGIPPVNTAYQFKVEAHEGNVATVAASDFVTVYGLASGSNALTTIISNESHSIPADSTGSPTSYAGSGTTIRLYEGSTELTYVASAPAAGQWTVIASPTNITTGSFTATLGYLTVGNHSAITSSTASIDYNISGNRQNGTAIPSFKRIQSLVKTNAGTNGAGGSPAQYIIVTGDQAFRYSSDSTTSVPAQITLSAELYGGLTTYDWQYYNTTNSAWSPASVTTQTYTVSPATAGFTGNSFRVRCVSGAFTDEITLVKLFDGTNAKVGYLTNEAFVSTTNSSGGSPVYDGGNGVFKVFNGITDISTGAGTSYGVLSGTGTPSPVASVTRNGLTLAIGAATGIYSPSGAAWSTNSESFTLRATTNAANGSVVIDKVFNIAKSRAGSPGATGNPGTNVATVYLYQRTTTTTSPNMPADVITYTFSSGNVNSPNTGWSSTIPSFTGTNPYLWVTLATASNSASTDTINSNEWQAAKLLSQNGSDGSPGAAGFSTAVLSAYIRSAFAPSTNPGTIVYTFSTSAWTPTNGWSKTIPSANGLPLWAVSATAFSTASTDTVDSGDWSTPTKVLIDPTSAIGGNLTTQSENLAAWTFGSASVSPGISYLDGSTQFWKVYENTTASAYHDIAGPTPFASISVGDRVTVSANVMKGERSKMVMYLATDPWSPNNWPLSTFDLSAGVILGNSGSVADAGIFEVGNIGASKVYRIYITTVPATVATSTYPLFRTKLEDGTELYASASPGSGFYATRAQLSKGYLAEYLKTDATIIQNNAIVGDAFTGTTELRVKSVPTNNATIGSITSVATADGNSVITVPITYTQGAINADGAIVYYKEGNTGANSPANDHKGFSLDSTDSSTARNVQFTLKPNQAYNFSVRAYRRSEGGRKYTAFSGVSTHTSTAGNYTGNVNNISASTVTTNAANGATAFTGTAKYRTAGAPTNLVSPTNISAQSNSNATKTIRVSWAAYTQGTNQADVIGLFYRRDNLIPTYTDSCVVMNVNVNTPAYYDLQGVNPADQYSFGIAAGRRTESGIEWGLINTTYGTGTLSLFGPDVSVYNGGVYPGGTLSPWTDFTPDGQSTWRVADTSTTQFGGTNLTSTSTTISATERWMVEGWVKKPTGGSLVRKIFRIYGSDFSYGQINFDSAGSITGDGVGYAEHSVETVNVGGTEWYRMYVAANISPGITTLVSTVYPSVFSPNNLAWSPEYTGEVITGPIAIRKRVTASTGFDWTAITASTVNFTGAIDGSPASQIRSGTANYRQDVSPTNDPSVPTITQSATADGNVVAKVAYTYSQGAIPADFVLIYAKEGGGTISPAVMSFATNAVSGDLSLVLKPSITYRFATQAVRRTETGIKGGNIISSADILLTSPNYTGLIAGSPATTVRDNANNAFTGTANYRQDVSPSSDPALLTIVQSATADGNIVVKVPFTYSPGSIPADFILIYTKEGGGTISPAVQAYPTNPVTGDMSFVLKPSITYRFAAQAVRRTESGLKGGNIISSADINLTSPNYTGLISGSPAAAIVLNANTAFSGTAKYRTAGAPTNLPVPTGIVSTPNSNATKTIRISWAAYIQGANQADVIGIFYRRDNTIPTYIDTCVIMNVNLNTPGVFELTGVNPADPYSFGIAAGRRTEDGIEWSEINTTYGTNPYYLYSASYPLANPTSGSGAQISPWTDFTPNGEITHRITDDSVNFEGAAWAVSPSMLNLITQRWMAEAWIKQETGTTKTALFRVYASNSSYADLIINPTNGNIVSVGGPSSLVSPEGFVETVFKDATTWYRVGVSSNISPNLNFINAELYPTIGTIPSGAYSPDASSTFGIVIGGVEVRKRTNSNAGFDWTAITADTVDFTGNIAGSPSTTVRDNARNAFDGTSEIRNTAVPTNNATIGSITSAATIDGNSVITVPVTYTQGAIKADGVVVYYAEGASGANAKTNDHKGFSLDLDDSSTARNIQFTLKPNQQYNFSVRAYRRSEGGRRYTTFSGVSTHTSTASNYTTLLSNISVRESFDYANVTDLPWTNVLGAGETSFGSPGIAGGKFLRLGNSAGDDQVWYIFNKSIPYDSDKIYRYRIRARQASATSPSDTLFYAGVAGRDATDTQYVNQAGLNQIGSQFYIAAEAAPITPANTWVTYTGYFGGTGAYTGSVNSWINPCGLHANVRYIRPLFLVNYQNKVGIADIDEVVLEVVENNFTGRINGSPAADIQSSAFNYRTSNDQNGTTPTTPTMGAISTVATNDNASVNIRIPWSFTATTGQTAGNIDGFIIWMYDSATSGSYTINGSPASDETAFVVKPGARQYIVKNLAPNRYYTFAVQAYRKVALNVNSSGIIYSGFSQNNTTLTQPAATANFTGSIAGSPATTVRDNARNAFDGTSEIRNTAVPTNNATIGSITSVATQDGNSVITVPITYTQGAINADGAIVYYKEGNTGANSPANDHKGFSLDSTDSSTARNVQFTLKPNQAYNFSVRAYRRAEGGRKYTAFSGVSTHTSTSSNYTGDLGGVPAATVIASNSVGGNLIIQSENIAAWSVANVYTSIPINYLDTSTPFFKIHESNTTNAYHDIYSSGFSVAIGETITASFYVRASERTTMAFYLEATPWSGNYPQAFFNLATGVMTASAFCADAGIIQVGSIGGINVYRVYITSVAATAAGNSFIIMRPQLSGSDQYVGTVGYGLCATRAQVNRGLLADYVKTTTFPIENTARLGEGFIGTSKYRTAGAPTNLVIPTGITSTPNSNGTKTLKVTWAAYTQGTNQADVIGLFYRKDNNIPTYVDSCVVMNVNLNAPAYYELQGVNPADQYSFGIAAGRRTESGIEWGLINTTYGSNPWRLFENDVLTSRVPASGGAGVATSAFYTPNGELSYTLTDNNNTNFLSTYLSTGGISPTPSSERWMAETWIKQDTSSANTNILRLFSSNAPGFQYTDLALRYDNGVVTNFGSTWASSSAEYYVENHTLPDGQVWYKVGVSHLTSPGASDVYLEIYPAVGSPGVAYSAIATGSGTYGGFAIRKVRTASTGFDWTAVTADTVNFTGNIGGSPAATVAANAVSGSTAFTGTISFRDGVAPNGTGASISATTGTATADGNVVVTVTYSYTNTGSRLADTYLIFVREGGGTVLSSDPCFASNPVSGTVQFTLKPSTSYTFGFSASRVTSSGNFATAITTSAGITTVAGNYTGNVNSIAASTVTTNAANGATAFSGTANYRAAGAPNGTLAAAFTTSGANTGTATADGNVVVTVTYNYTQSTIIADRFIILVRDGGGTVVATDPAFITNAASGSNTITFTLKPSNTYTFGFAAARTTESGELASAITTSNSITTVAGNYTGNVNTVSSELISQTPVFEAYNPATFNFKNSTNGWTATNANLTTNATYLAISPTAGDPQLRRLNLSFSGAIYDKIRARIRRAGGTGVWEGVIYYGTSAGPAPHGESGSYFKVSSTVVANPNNWNVYEWDMANLNAGGTDWISSTIDRLRLDVSQDTNSNWEIDWITVGRTGIPTYGAEYGASPSNLIGLSGDGINRVVQRYAGGFNAVEFDNTQNNANTGVLFPVTKGTGISYASVTAGNGTNGPTTGFYGSHSIKIVPGTGTRVAYFSTASNAYNMPLEPNSKWILSAKTWAASPSTFPTSMNLGVLTAVSPTTGYFVTHSIPAAQTWGNLSGILNLKNDSSTSGLLYTSIAGTTTQSVYLDGIMLEKKVGPGTTPTPWVKSSQTGISGTLKGTAVVNPTNLSVGTLLSGMGLNQGDGVARPVLSGLYVGYVRDGDNITFPTAYSSTPTVVFLPGAKSTGSPVSVNQSTTYEAINLTPTGFTAKIKLTGLSSSVSPITDNVSTAGSPILSPGSPDSAGYTGNPAASYSINKTNSAEAWDDRYTFNYNVTINNIWTDTWEPGNATFGIYVRKTTGWYLVGTPTIFGGTGGSTTTKNVSSIAIVDGIIRNTAAGQNEFAIRILSSGGSLNSFTSVTYSVANAPTQQSATEATSAAVPFIVIANSGGT